MCNSFFNLIVPKIVTNTSGIEKFNFEEIFENFGSSETLIIDKNGKFTISGRVVTNNLSFIKKQSNGSYSCSIQGGKITIYPVGVKSPQGNSNKVRIEVSEYGGALCFQSE